MSIYKIVTHLFACCWSEKPTGNKSLPLPGAAYTHHVGTIKLLLRGALLLHGMEYVLIRGRVGEIEMSRMINKSINYYELLH